MTSTPSMPSLVEDPSAVHSQPVSQQTTPATTFYDQSPFPSGPISRWQGPGQPWPQQPAPESPLVAGALSPLSQFGQGWPGPPALNRPWATPSHNPSTAVPSQATSTVVSPPWPSTPFPGAHNPVDPAYTGRTQSDATALTHPWGWARQWAKGHERFGSSASSVTSSPDSRDSPGDRALTPFQSLSRHDSVTTISSGYSKSSATHVQSDYAMATGRPPQQWRSDFKMPRTGLAALMPRKKRTIGHPVRHNPKAVLSPYLRYNGQDPPVYWDIQTRPPTVLFRDLERPSKDGEFTRFVCEPPARLMRIYHARVPWYVDVRASGNPVGVTFADLFREIYEVMQIQIVDADFHNDEVDDEERKRIASAYRSRVGSDQAEAMKGIRRVDFLMGRVIFEGLVKGKEGLWEMKTTKPIQLP